MKEKVEREGIDVNPESGLVWFILNIGHRYMMWRYHEPTASIKREIAILVFLTCFCFVPFYYVLWVLKAQVTPERICVSAGFAIFGAILILGLGVVFYRRCGNCHGYFGIDRVDSKEVSRKVVRTEQETRITPIYRNTYRCVYCGNTYTKNQRGETEIITNKQGLTEILNLHDNRRQERVQNESGKKREKMSFLWKRTYRRHISFAVECERKQSRVSVASRT